MTDSHRFVVAGRDLEPFVSSWFEHLRDGGGEMQGILNEGPDYSNIFLMGNIGPRATQGDASEEELLFFGVLAIAQEYQRENRLGDPLLHDWDDRWKYIEAAFDYLHEIGEHEGAVVLVKSVMRRAQRGPKGWQEFQNRYWAKRSDAQRAEHERRMASIMQRELRVAKLLDPEVDVDAVLLSMPLNED